jgi:hypothetical protein
LCVDGEHRIDASTRQQRHSSTSVSPNKRWEALSDDFYPRASSTPLPRRGHHAQLEFEGFGSLYPGKSVAIDVGVSFEQHPEQETTTVLQGI